MIQEPTTFGMHRPTRTPLDWLAGALLTVGGLNWGLIGFFGFDLVAAIFGPMSSVTRIIYALVGLAAVYCLIRAFVPSKQPTVVVR